MYRKRSIAEEDAVRDRASGLTSWYERSARLVLENHPKVVWAVTLFPLLFIMLMAVGKLFAPRLYRYAIAEDNLVEYATFLTYMLASFVATTLAIDLRRQAERVYCVAYSLLAVGLFLIAMEEISWGQRLAGVETPSFLETRNYKEELNFHNIRGFPLHNVFIVVGFYGAFSRLLVPGPLKRRYPRMVDLFTPPYPLFLYFFVPGLLYVYYQYMYYKYILPLHMTTAAFYADSFVTAKEQEPIELLLSLGFLLFVVVNRHRYHRGVTQAWVTR